MNFAIQPVLACPQCGFDQFMPTWVTFALIRLLVYAAIAFRCLDVVRVTGLFVAFEVAYFCLFQFVLWHLHPASVGNFIAMAGETFLLLWASGVIAAGVMKVASGYPYFQTPSRSKFTWGRALFLVPPLSGIAYLQFFYFFAC